MCVYMYIHRAFQVFHFRTGLDSKLNCDITRLISSKPVYLIEKALGVEYIGWYVDLITSMELIGKSDFMCFGCTTDCKHISFFSHYRRLYGENVNALPCLDLYWSKSRLSDVKIQVVYSSLLQICLQEKSRPLLMQTRTFRGNQNSKVVGLITGTMSWKTLKRFFEQREAADQVMYVCYCDWPLSHEIFSFDLLLIRFGKVNFVIYQSAFPLIFQKFLSTARENITFLMRSTLM